MTLDEAYKTFWDSESFAYPDGPSYTPAPGATDDEIVELERALGRQLPLEFRDLLRIQDGGHVWLMLGDATVFKIDCCRKTPTGARSLWRNVKLTPTEKGELGIPEGVFIFGWEMHSWYGLDYRTNQSEPSVIYYDEYKDEIEVVGTTFRQFLLSLNPPLDDDATEE
jgi:hypothetical protein